MRGRNRAKSDRSPLRWNTTSQNYHRRLRCEPLEDRRLLSALSLNIDDPSISEADGAGATTATVTRDTDTTDPLVVYLASNDTTEATVPSSVTIPAGQASIAFDIDAVDDALVDGTQTVTISASSQLSSPLSLDPSFSGDGKATQDSGVNAIALQPDGKIVAVSGYHTGDSSNYSDFSITRYLADGTLDTGFGSGGVVNTDVTGESEVPYGVAVQEDGKIVVAGDWYHGSQRDFVLVRYNSDGTLDTSFDGDGKVVTELSSSYNKIWDMAIQPDGKILVGGSIDGDFAVARYNADGSLDPGFGSGGTVRTDVGLGDHAFGIALQSDGKILLAGQSSGGNSSSKFVLTRYTSAGVLDSSFGSVGKVQTDIVGSFEGARDLAIQPDGKIVAVGSVRTDGVSPAEYNFALARYNTDGTLDTTFGAGGTTITDFGGEDDQALGVAIQADGTIIVVGSATAGRKAGLARYHADGTLDMIDFSSSSVMQANDVVIQPGGGVVVGGGFIYSYGGFVARYAGVSVMDTLEVTDNDIAGFIIDPPGTLITVEAGQTAEFTIALAGPPTADITINLSSGDDTEGRVSPSSLTFTPEYWYKKKKVYVTGLDDSEVDGDVTYSVVTSVATSDDPRYNGLNPADVSVINRDNDTPTLTLTIDTPSISESDVPAATTATLTRGADTTDLLEVCLLSSDTTEATVPSTVTIPAGQESVTFDIDAVDDVLVDGTQAVTISASPQLNPPLAFDQSFSGDGKVRQDTNVNDIAVQADGKVVAVSGYRARTRSPTVISPRGMLDPWALQNSAWKKRIARLIFEDRNLQGAACLHALNDCEAASMRAFGLGNPIAVIANGVAVPDLGGERPPRPACFGSDGRRVLLFLGRIHPKKGLAETLDA